MRIVTASLLICLLCAGLLCSQEAQKELGVTEKYREVGRDPFRPKISKDADSEEEIIIQPPGNENDDGDPPDRDTTMAVKYRNRIIGYYQTAEDMVRKRNYEGIIQNCDKGLDSLESLEKLQREKGIDLYARIDFVQKDVDRYKQLFKRMRASAQEGKLQKEAMDDFQKRNIVLQGIIWAPEDPVVILDGNGLHENDPYKGVLIKEIKRDKLYVIFRYKNRQFKYTLEFQE